MKYTLTLLFILFSSITFAQGGALADLKFEEAEIAFNNKDYNTTISKLNEFDKMYGSVTSKSLYLRIVSQNKLYNENKYDENAEFTLLSSLRKNAESYLKAMESSGLDDKYREVYAIKEKLEKFPKDKEAYIKKKKYDLEVQQKSEQIIDELKRLSLKIEEWNFNENIKIGMKYQTFAKLNPKLKMHESQLGILDNGINTNIYVWMPSKKEEKKNQELFKDLSFTTYNGDIVNYTIALKSIAIKEDMDKKIVEILEQFDRRFLYENHEGTKLNYIITSVWATHSIHLTVEYTDGGGYKISITKILMNIDSYLK